MSIRRKARLFVGASVAILATALALSPALPVSAEPESSSAASYSPTFGLWGPTPAPNAIVNLSGHGFRPDLSVYVEFEGYGVIGSFNAESDGNLVSQIVIPKTIALGTYKLKVVQPYTTELGGDDTLWAEYYVYVGGFYPWAISSSYYTPAETDFTITGWNFQRGEWVDVYLDGVWYDQWLAEPSYSQQGKIEGTLALPTASAGSTVEVKFVGAETGATTSVWVTVAS